MTTALGNLWALAATATPDLHTTIVEAMREVDVLRAERDRLAAERGPVRVTTEMVRALEPAVAAYGCEAITASRMRECIEEVVNGAREVDVPDREAYARTLLREVDRQRRANEALAGRVIAAEEDRDRLAARVAELEAASVKHWRALQPLTDLLGTGGEMFAWENLIAALRQRMEGEPDADADPCPVDEDIIRRWADGFRAHGYAAGQGDIDTPSMRMALAWLLTRQVAAMREGRSP